MCSSPALVAVPALSIHAQQMVPTTSGSPLERAYARACRRPLLPLVLAGGRFALPPTDRKASRWRRRERRRGTGGRTQRGLREKSTSERAHGTGDRVTGEFRPEP